MRHGRDLEFRPPRRESQSMRPGPPCRRADPPSQASNSDLRGHGRDVGLLRPGCWSSDLLEEERECRGVATPLGVQRSLRFADTALHRFINELPVFWRLRAFPSELDLGKRTLHVRWYVFATLLQ